ncbi:MAG: prolyl oligopeptidase [Planctomycetaceae bacterium]|nr:prolyl oligopeptidase [Planctomycetaceae bacterium]
MHRCPILLGISIVVLGNGVLLAAETVPSKLPPLSEVKVTSTLDGTQQPSLLWASKTATTKPTPLLVFLHSWSGNYKQNNSAWQAEAVSRGWIYLHPDFRGRNDHPEACGSQLARRDILDAVDYVIKRYNVDQSRLYLAGASGGGHMSMLMAGHHPERFSAVSAWVGISDLAAWHRFHTKDGKPGRYAQMLEASVGGAPGSSDKVDAELRDRSPIFHLQRAKGVPIRFSAGATDGFTGSVPTTHSLNAFNVLARANKTLPIPAETVEKLWNTRGLLAAKAEAFEVDPVYQRKVFFERTAGPAEVTLFDGGHEGLSAPAASWLATKVRATRGQD